MITRETIEQINSYAEEHNVSKAKACMHYGVNVSGYYHWIHRLKKGTLSKVDGRKTRYMKIRGEVPPKVIDLASTEETPRQTQKPVMLFIGLPHELINIARSFE